MNDIAFIVWWCSFVFVPLLLFLFRSQWRFFAIVLSCANLCFCSINNITLIFNDNLWGLLQTEIEVSKSVFVTYQSVLICLFIALLLIAYRCIKIRMLIFIYFMLCNILTPFNIIEKYLWGY